jgi:hypothetical protein
MYKHVLSCFLEGKFPISLQMYIGHDYNEPSDPWCGDHVTSVRPTSTLSTGP